MEKLSDKYREREPNGDLRLVVREMKDSEVLKVLLFLLDEVEALGGRLDKLEKPPKIK